MEELKQQLEQQCVINKELQRQNKDLGECQRGGVECGIKIRTLLRAERCEARPSFGRGFRSESTCTAGNELT